MLRKIFSKPLPIIRHYGFVTKISFADTLQQNIKREYRLSTLLYTGTVNSELLPVDEELQEIFKFKNTNTKAMAQAANFVRGLIAKIPMVFLSLTKCMSGIMAKPNCKLNITWLNMRSASTFSSP